MASVKIGATSVTLKLAKGETLEIPLAEWTELVSSLKAEPVTSTLAVAAPQAGKMPTPKLVGQVRPTYQGFRAPSSPERG